MCVRVGRRAGGGGGNILIHKLLFKLHTCSTNQVILSLSLFLGGWGDVIIT